MKKIKKISVRVSQQVYEMLVSGYMWHKDFPKLSEIYYNQEIKTFSDYIRLIIQIGLNE